MQIDANAKWRKLDKIEHSDSQKSDKILGDYRFKRPQYWLASCLDPIDTGD